MDALEFLEQVKKLDQLIDAKIAERDRLIALATNISPCPMDGMPFSNTCTVSRKIENTVINLIMVEEELDKIIDEYLDYKQSVVRMLEKLPALEYGVLHRYYIQYMTWEQVAEAIGYCTTQVWRIKKNALSLLQSVIECNE